MYRHRNRPKYSDEELAQIYDAPHEHRHWKDHIHRVDRTIEIAKPLFHREGLSVADLSCGDAAIAKALQPQPSLRFLGDYAPGYEYHGPIEETIDQIPQVFAFVCSETIEHLDDPDTVLKQIRGKASKLILSTPWMQWPDHNIEHYWSFDDEAVREMLEAADWTPLSYEKFYTGLGYRYQIWTAE